MDTFWMVIIDDKASCSKRHPTFEEARIEAARLVRQEAATGSVRGATILKAVVYGRIDSASIAWEDFKATSGTPTVRRGHRQTADNDIGAEEGTGGRNESKKL